MNSKKNLVSFVLVVAILLSASSVMAQTPVDPLDQKTTLKESPSLTGPKKLPSPTDPIDVKEINIRAENPVWSPTGDKIAFIRAEDDVWVGDPHHRQLCVIETNSGNSKVIASISSLPKNFCWSPDGKKIAFVEADTKNCNIYTVDLATQTRTKLTNHEEHRNPRSAYCYLSWSPDGTKIAFAIAGPEGGGAFEIWVADAQGKFWFKLTEGFSPVWFPNSKKIVFATGSPENHSWFFIIDIDGKNPIKIEDPGGAFGYLRDICLSPDSNSVICSSRILLNIAKLNGKKPTTITVYGDRSDRLPYILGITGRTMTIIRDGNVQIIDIKKLAPVGGKYDVRPPNGAIISQFKAPNLIDKEKTIYYNNSYRPLWAWSPDNKEIAFVGKDNEIWKMNANGTNQKQLTFERTKLVQQAQQEQKKEKALAREKLESELKK